LERSGDDRLKITLVAVANGQRIKLLAMVADEAAFRDLPRPAAGIECKQTDKRMPYLCSCFAMILSSLVADA